MTLTQILRLLGPDFLVELFEERLGGGLTQPESLTSDISELAANMLLEDPALPQRLEVAVEGKAHRNEILRGVVTFMREQGRASLHYRALEIERFFGLGSKTKITRLVDTATLTASQRAAYREICALSEIYFSGEAMTDGVSLRIAPLVIGPSGVGKTHVITMAARALGLPVIRMTVGDWIIQAARQPPCALEVLQQHLNQHHRFVLFIDELDKLSLSRIGSEYSRFQHAEIYAALDRSITYHCARGSSWTEEHAEKLRHNVMIVGGGTWHDLWKDSHRRPLGFGQTAQDTDDISKQIRQARIIPDELLNRFSDRWLLLHPYTVEDFQTLARQIGLGSEDFDPVAAVASGGNFRAIQNALTSRALKRYYTQHPAV